MYPIVKPFLPPLDEYQRYIEGIFTRNYMTNNGPLLQELEQGLKTHLGVENLLLVANGTIALQLVYEVLNIKGRVLTTPFSFAATASSLCWQKLQPEFIDIDRESLNLDLNQISATQWQSADAILPVHVFGNPCEVEAIAELAHQHNVKVVYDAAHAFGSDYKKGSVLNYGDAATLSLHATKLFHTVEGGAVIFKRREDYEKAKKLINFGFNEYNAPEFIGINAKMSEVHAAMGLANLSKIDFILQQRKSIVQTYFSQLHDHVSLQQWHEHGDNNGAYMPVILSSEQELLHVMAYLTDHGIQTRRYFYPSLSEVPVYGMLGDTPIANDISLRVLCLPMFTDLTCDDVVIICDALKAALSQTE